MTNYQKLPRFNVKTAKQANEYYKNFDALLRSTAQVQRLALVQDDAVTSDERKWELKSLKSYLQTSYLTGLKLCEIGLKEENNEQH